MHPSLGLLAPSVHAHVGLRPKTSWSGQTHAKGYLQDDFTETFRRYIPKSELSALIAELRNPTL